MGGASGVDVEELGGHLEQLFLDLRLALLERLALQRIELRLRGIAADVFLDLAQPPDRHVEAVLSGGLQQDEVGSEAAPNQAGEGGVAGGALLDVGPQNALL